MKIKDTLTGEKINLEKKGVKHLFVCGPTVYDYSHIGHARTYLAFDIAVRYLRHSGIKIKYVQNITDVDDKIINRAKEKNISPFELSCKFEEEYFKDMKRLGINSVNHYVRATNVIPEIIAQIKKLEDKGYAYKTETGIYFKVRKFKDYGKLSNQNIDALESGARVKPEESKEDKLDFALWKFPKSKEEINEKNGPVIKNGEPLWPSPWGWGRPGWHIEDTAISEKYFGPQYDIHGGAEDLKFPHHESEIAQQEAASGLKPFVKIWMHTGFLNIGGEKMSKSLNNFLTIQDFLKEYSPKTFRFMILSHHYRSRFDYTPELIKKTKRTLKNLENFIEKTYFVSKKAKRFSKKTNIKEEIQETKKLFEEAMEDDLNTPKALGYIFKLIRKSENQIWELNRKDALRLKKFLVKTFKVFGFNFKELGEQSKEKKRAEIISKKREIFRSNKQFIKADELREKIHGLGYKIEDTPLGPFVCKK
jgi:cysteinyl-tRNA synthetase